MNTENWGGIVSDFHRARMEMKVRELNVKFDLVDEFAGTLCEAFNQALESGGYDSAEAMSVAEMHAIRCEVQTLRRVVFGGEESPANKQIRALQAQCEAQKKEIHALQDQCEAHEKKASNYRTQAAASQEKCKEMGTLREQLKDAVKKCGEVDTLRIQMHALRGQVKAAAGQSEEIRALRAQCSAAEKQSSAERITAEKLAEANRSRKKHARQLAQVQGELLIATRTTEQLKAKLADSETERIEMAKKVADLPQVMAEQVVGKYQAEYVKIHMVLATKEKELAALRAEESKNLKRLGATTGELAQSQKKNIVQQALIDALRPKMDAVEKQLSMEQTRRRTGEDRLMGLAEQIYTCLTGKQFIFSGERAAVTLLCEIDQIATGAMIGVPDSGAIVARFVTACKALRDSIRRMIAHISDERIHTLSNEIYADARKSKTVETLD